MRTIVLNSSNLVQDGQNNKLIYNFPNSVQFKDDFIALAQVSMYYSWFNISSLLQNNIFTYSWVVGVTKTIYTITIPDGLYEVATINQLLQFTMIANGHYLVNTAGQNVYYAEFIVNPARYAVQINTYLVPTSLPSGFTNPASLSFPTQTFNPEITLVDNITKLLGYPVITTQINTNNSYTPPAGDPYVSKLANGTLSYISVSSPNLQPNSSILFAVSNINNPYAQPSSIIYSLTPYVGFGEIISDKPSEFTWNRLIDGTYNQLVITILGLDLQPIKINDPSITILLALKNKDEYSMK